MQFFLAHHLLREFPLLVVVTVDVERRRAVVDTLVFFIFECDRRNGRELQTKARWNDHVSGGALHAKSSSGASTGSSHIWGVPHQNREGILK